MRLASSLGPLFLLSLGCCLFASPPVVDVCQLVKDPAAFNGKMISVRARVIVEFEDSEIVLPKCQEQSINGIWLEYGRGVKQPTTWCCGDFDSKDPLKARFDQDFELFDRYVTARENAKRVYAVTATISGRFDSVPAKVCPDRKHLCPTSGGFGHLGAYVAQLVLQSVSDVSATKIQ